jgi:hypothetical protein
MADNKVLAQIDELIEEEKALRAQTAGVGLGSEERERLGEIERRLDQCWDLLRQRRARAEFNEDPDDASVRPISEVESYRQ